MATERQMTWDEVVAEMVCYRERADKAEALVKTMEAALEPIAYWVHDMHLARQPVKARGKFPEIEEYVYPASRRGHAEETARIMRGECTPLYTRTPKEQS